MKRLISSCLAVFLLAQLWGGVILGTRSEVEKTVIPDAAEDGDVLKIMRLAKDGGQVSDNLLGTWSGWGQGFVREDQQSHEGTVRSVYRCDNESSSTEAGLYQYLSETNNSGTYTLSGWSKAQGVTRDQGTEYYSYCLATYITYMDGDSKWFHTGFTYGTHDWEYREVSFTAQKAIKTMVIYAFMRGPGYGTAWFDDISLVKGEAQSTSTFQDMPVQVLQTAPEQLTKTILKTKDGLEMGLGDSIVTSLKVDGTEIANNAYSGFLVRDAAETTDTGVYAFAPGSGSKPQAFRGNQSTLGLNISADYKENNNHIAVSGVIKDATNAAEGRAVQLSYALPVTASGWKWGMNIQESRDITTGESGNIYKELGFGEISVDEWDGPAHTLYPTSVIYNDDLGIAIAVSMDFPSYYTLEYNGSTNQYILTYNLGIVPEAPDAARFEFVIYRIDDPEWGFRSATKKYTQISPDYYEVRIKDQGVWVAWISTSNIFGVEDFNLKFKEEDGDYFRKDGTFEYKNGILGYQYIEPGDWWLKNMTDRTYSSLLDAIDAQALQDKSLAATRQAIATKVCANLDSFGNLSCNLVNVPWAPNGAQIHINANPKLPGEYNFYNLYLSQEQKDTLFDPAKAKGVPFDGVYLDELSGWWMGNANFNKEHYQYTTVPLTYSPYYKKPMLHRASTTWEFVKKLSTDLHSIGKTVFANKCPDKYSFYTPYVDAMGTEMTALNGSVYAPQSIESLSMWRTLAYQKPFCILLSNDYDVFDHNMMEKYFQRCLAFGIFPSPCGSYSDDMQYFTSWELYYNRDRDIWKKYMPVLKTVAEAGWEPVTLVTADNDQVLVERYGISADKGVYFSVFNQSSQQQLVTLSIPMTEVNVRPDCEFTEVTNQENISLADGKYTVTLKPEQTIVLSLKNSQSSTIATKTRKGWLTKLLYGISAMIALVVATIIMLVLKNRRVKFKFIK